MSLLITNEPFLTEHGRPRPGLRTRWGFCPYTYAHSPDWRKHAIWSPEDYSLREAKQWLKKSVKHKRLILQAEGKDPAPYHHTVWALMPFR